MCPTLLVAAQGPGTRRVDPPPAAHSSASACPGAPAVSPARPQPSAQSSWRGGFQEAGPAPGRDCLSTLTLQVQAGLQLTLVLARFLPALSSSPPRPRLLLTHFLLRVPHLELRTWGASPKGPQTDAERGVGSPVSTPSPNIWQHFACLVASFLWFLKSCSIL